MAAEVKEISVVKIAKDLHRYVQLVATWRGIQIYEYLDELLRERVKSDWAACVKEMNASEKKRS